MSTSHLAPRTSHLAPRTSYLALMAFSLQLVACDPDKEESQDEGCEKDTGGLAGLEPLSDFSGTTVCEADSNGHVTLTGHTILLHETVGYTIGSESSADPGETNKGITTHRTSGLCTGSTPAEVRTLGSGMIDPASSSDIWHTDDTSGSLDECGFSCGQDDCDACSGQYEVRIVRPAEVTDCQDFYPVRIDLHLQSHLADWKDTSESECSAGSGRFHLVPVSHGDRDHDDDMHVSFLPIQTSGTGTMTKSAWITGVDLVDSPTGTTLRVIESNETYRFAASDMLVNANSISRVISGKHTFDQGIISGNAPFVVEELDNADFGEFDVDIEWVCGTGASTVTRPQGWSFELDDIGCSYPQKLTLRYGTSPNRLEVEQYGNPTFRHVVPTQTVAAGEAFTFEIGRLTVEGVLLSHNAQQAQVRLDELMWNDTDICATGTYDFAAE